MCTSRLHLARNRVRAAMFLLLGALALVSLAFNAIEEAQEEHDDALQSERHYWRGRLDEHQADTGGGDQADAGEEQYSQPDPAYLAQDGRGGRRHKGAG